MDTVATPLCVRNRHRRDRLIIFDEESHSYYYCLKSTDDAGVETRQRFSKSVTGLIKEFKASSVFNSAKTVSKFYERWKSDESSKYYEYISKLASDGKTDAEVRANIQNIWSSLGRIESANGKKLHAFIESRLNGGVLPTTTAEEEESDVRLCCPETASLLGGDRELARVFYEADARDAYLENYEKSPRKDLSTELGFFEKWLADNPDLIPFRTEWSVFSQKLDLAGQIDAVFVRRDSDEFVIVDWKRVRDLDEENRFGRWCSPPFEGVPDTPFGHYSLQLNFYRKLLSLNYSDVVKKVTELRIVQLHSDLSDYREFRVSIIDNF